MKYQLKQLVYLMIDNKVHSAEVISRALIENSELAATATTDFQRNFYLPFGHIYNENLESGAYYRTCHGIYPESALFATKEELLASL